MINIVYALVKNISCCLNVICHPSNVCGYHCDKIQILQSDAESVVVFRSICVSSKWAIKHTVTITKELLKLLPLWVYSYFWMGTDGHALMKNQLLLPVLPSLCPAPSSSLCPFRLTHAWSRATAGLQPENQRFPLALRAPVMSREGPPQTCENWLRYIPPLTGRETQVRAHPSFIFNGQCWGGVLFSWWVISESLFSWITVRIKSDGKHR